MHIRYTTAEVIALANYKEMYLRLFRATEAAIRCLIEAQRECEEDYLASPEPELKVLEPGTFAEPDSGERKEKRKRKTGLLFVGFVLAFCLGSVVDMSFPWPEPEQCVVCGGESYDAPCLLNVATGEMDEMQGTLVPGVFHFINCAGIWGAWDSDAQSCRVGLTEGSEEMNGKLFCKRCRELIGERVPGSYAVLDLSDPLEPQIYPVVSGAVYHMLGQTVLVEDRGEEVALSVFPTEVPLEAAPWNEIA